MTRRPWLVRVLAGGLLAVFLGGPTPGAVGSCAGDSTELDQPVDFELYCSEREQLICVRRYERGELSLEARDDCRRQVIDRCSKRSFAPNCRPSRRDANTCLNALHSRSTLDRTFDQLDECKKVCSIPLSIDEPRSIATPDGPDAGSEGE